MLGSTVAKNQISNGECIGWTNIPLTKKTFIF